MPIRTSRARAGEASTHEDTDITSARDWKQCAQIALAKNTDVVAAMRGLESARALSKGAFSPFVPTIAATMNAARSGDTDIRRQDNFTVNSNFSAALTLSQNLFAGFADAARLEQAHLDEETSSAALRIARSKALNDLTIAFQGLAYAKETERLSEEIVDRREQNLRLVTLRFESGRENKGSVLLSEANLEQAKYELLRAVDQIPATQAQLARALGDDGRVVDVTGDAPTSPLPTPLPDFDALALSLPESAQSRLKAQSERQKVIIARAAFFPTLIASASVGRLGDDFFPKKETWQTGLALSFPIFNGGHDYYGTQSASSLAAAADASHAGTVRQLVVALTQAYENFAENEQKLRVDAIFVKATSARSEISRRKYENGLLSFDEWDIIENDLINRQRAYLASKQNRVLAERSWRQAISQEEIL